MDDFENAHTFTLGPSDFINHLTPGLLKVG
jgi:hypothetical protein